jgi:hypothetical protein
MTFSTVLSWKLAHSVCSCINICRHVICQKIKLPSLVIHPSVRVLSILSVETSSNLIYTPFFFHPVARPNYLADAWFSLKFFKINTLNVHRNLTIDAVCFFLFEPFWLFELYCNLHYIMSTQIDNLMDCDMSSCSIKPVK